MTMRQGSNRCDYVIRQAGHSVDGRPIEVGYGGDRTETCRKSGSAVPHTYYTKQPGTTNVMVPHEGTVIRCPEHADAP